MSYPSRPPLVPGLPPMFMGVPGMPPPVGMGIPPPLMGNHPPNQPFFGGPPGMRSGPGGHPQMGQNHNIRMSQPPSITKPPITITYSAPTSTNTTTANNNEKHPEHPQPLPPPVGPPVTVFVGNITEKWPDAMIRQLLATCGQVLNWRRVQGASGKLQGFGFCEFNGPDSGLRAVRLLHELEVGDKKLVVKVDAKTSTVLEEFKADRKKKNAENGEQKPEEDKSENPSEDYMDQEMRDADERSKTRIGIIFREFKTELDSYVPPGGENKEKEITTNKQQIQDKLHLLKLSSLEKTDKQLAKQHQDDLAEDLAMEEGKREIITREISNLLENMKQEKQREEERKKMGRERREREREREEKRKKGTDDITSPEHSRGRDRDRDRDRMRDRDRRGRSRDNDRERERERERERDRGRDRDRDNRDRMRRRSRERRITRSRSRERITRSPLQQTQPKPRYREREEEEEEVEQKRLERKAREKEAAYEERLREWEAREANKAREYKKYKERQKRQEKEVQVEAKVMKQFLEDYEDEKHDSKYYKGKDLQKRLAERAKELEADNKDRQKEREELEDIKLKMLTSSTSNNNTSTPTRLFEKYKKPMLDTTNTMTSNPTPTAQVLPNWKTEAAKRSPIASRLQALSQTSTVNNNTFPHHRNNGIANEVSKSTREIDSRHDTEANCPPSPISVNQIPPPARPEVQQTSFSAINFPPFVPIKSNPSTPNSINSPLPANDNQSGTSNKSFTPSGFNLNLNSNSNSSHSNLNRREDEDSRHSFSSAPSPGMVSPMNFSGGMEDDSSMQGLSPDLPKKKKIDLKDVFNQDEDDNDALGLGRKRKLVPLDYGEESKKLKKEDKIQEDKKKHIKTLIDKIPTEKDALFAYEIDWDMVDSSLMEKRIRPWINKKIIEYIGEPEPTLVDFICSKVLGRSAPKSILEDVMMVLDEEAEVFVVKMWRLLVYEIEAKKYGIVGGKAQ